MSIDIAFGDPTVNQIQIACELSLTVAEVAQVCACLEATSMSSRYFLNAAKEFSSYREELLFDTARMALATSHLLGINGAQVNRQKCVDIICNWIKSQKKGPE